MVLWLKMRAEDGVGRDHGLASETVEDSALGDRFSILVGQPTNPLIPSQFLDQVTYRPNHPKGSRTARCEPVVLVVARVTEVIDLRIGVGSRSVTRLSLGGRRRRLKISEAASS
jgi:hypothetical protein